MSNPQPPNPFRVARVEGVADAALQAAAAAGVANVVVCVLVHDTETGACVYRGAAEAVVAQQMLATVIAHQFAQLMQWRQNGRGPGGAL